MIYNKKRAFFKSIIHNNNNKIYLALVVIMIAVITVITTNVITDYQETETTQAASETSSQEVSGAFSGENSTDETASITDDIKLTDTAIFIYLDNKILAVKKLDKNNEYSDTIATARCYVAEDIYDMLGNEETIRISTDENGTKKLWTELYESVYTQYFTTYSSISVHSPLYTEYGNYNSILAESYSAIEDDSEHFSYGVTVTANAAKWLYENVPLGIDIYIIKSEKNIDEINNLDSKYIINNHLLEIPKNFTSDPTDANASSMWCDTEYSYMEGVADISREFGTIAFSILSKDIDYLHQLYNIKAYNTAGEDISAYINLGFDLTGYTQEELAACNYQGWLLPGQYPVTIILADMYGNYIYEMVFLNIVDTTPPVINFNHNVTEINREQMANDEYMRGLVTITELYQLTNESVTYRIEEQDGIATIYYSVIDASGNVGDLAVSLTIR